MKTLEISKASKPLADYAHHLGKDTIIVLDKKRPVAALVSLRSIDREALSLSNDPEFLRIIKASRVQVRHGKTLSLAQIRRQLARKGTPSQPVQPSISSKGRAGRNLRKPHGDDPTMG